MPKRGLPEGLDFSVCIRDRCLIIFLICDIKICYLSFISSFFLLIGLCQLSVHPFISLLYNTFIIVLVSFISVVTCVVGIREYYFFREGITLSLLLKLIYFTLFFSCLIIYLYSFQ